MTTLTEHPLYATWLAMKKRCTNPNAIDYHYYGGRGVTVCDRWLNSFDAFCEDMGERPEGHTLDREDTNKGYSPENCVWATRKDQVYNRRITYTANCIRKRGPNSFQVALRLRKGVDHRRTFQSLQKAEDYLADCRFEREMHHRLGL